MWSGRAGYCFVIDAFTRQWLAFVLASRATRRHAIMAVNNAVAAANPVLPGLTIRVDNGYQYTSREFRSSVAALGITLEYIYVNIPEQNGHIESFHNTLKEMSGRVSLRTSERPGRRCGLHSRATTTAESTLRWGI